jgi:hypothetical protein
MNQFLTSGAAGSSRKNRLAGAHPLPREAGFDRVKRRLRAAQTD